MSIEKTVNTINGLIRERYAEKYGELTPLLNVGQCPRMEAIQHSDESSPTVTLYLLVGENTRYPVWDSLRVNVKRIKKQGEKVTSSGPRLGRHGYYQAVFNWVEWKDIKMEDIEI